MSRVSFYATLAALVCWSSSLFGQTKDAGQTFVFLADERPLVIRLHCTVDGKPLQRVWKECMAAIFQQLDRDQDGKLDRREAEKAVAPSMVFGGSGLNLSFPEFADLDFDQNGVVSPTELERYFENNGGGALHFTQTSGIPNPWAVSYLGQRPYLVNSDSVNKKFFELLDRNADQKLSRKELANAAAIFQKLDTDDDETIDLDELIPIGPARPVAFSFSGSYVSPSYVQQKRSELFRVDASEDRRDLVEKLTSKYGRDGKVVFTAKELSLTEKAFAMLDRDDNGTLDSEELLAFADRPADVELEAHFKDELVLKSRKSNGASYPIEMSDDRQSLAFAVGIDRILLGRKGTQATYEVAFFEQNFLNQFAGSDSDGNGYLDKTEASKNDTFRNTFTRLDADGDGKLFPKEVKSFLKSIRSLQKIAAKSSVSMNFSNQGYGLFDVLDTRPDGRLGIRELRNFVKLLKSLDKNKDGELGFNELPHNYQILLQKGRTQNLGYVVFSPGSGTGTNAKPPIPPSKGPVWFRKMDVNQDGDVSRREFLGPAEVFQRLDTDRDGLLDAQEAERAGK